MSGMSTNACFCGEYTYVLRNSLNILNGLALGAALLTPDCNTLITSEKAQDTACFDILGKGVSVDIEQCQSQGTA